MAKTNPSVIILKGDPIYKEFPLAPLDGCGNGAITPGMLVELTAGEVRPHSSQAGLAAPLMVAVEGLNIDANSKTMGDIDVDYDDDNGAVKVAYLKNGAEFYGLLKAGDSVAIHGLVESGSDGYLQAGSTNPVGRAIAAVNNSAGSTPARVKVEVL